MLIRRNSILVLDFGLHVVDRVGTLHLERDGLAGQGFDEDLHLKTVANVGSICALHLISSYDNHMGIQVMITIWLPY